MVIGAAARYKMPAFRPRAGFSPSCDAVLVQIEHCADATVVIATSTNINRDIKNNFFIAETGQR